MSDIEPIGAVRTVTLAQMAKTIAVLKSAFPTYPFPENAPAAYMVAFDDIAAVDLESATRRAIREMTFAPKPAELRNLALDCRDYRESEHWRNLPPRKESPALASPREVVDVLWERKYGELSRKHLPSGKIN